MFHISIFSHSDTLDNKVVPGRIVFNIILTIALFSLAPAWAQSVNPHAISLYNLGLTAYRQGSPESAIIFFKRATDIDPDLADAQYNLGVLYQSQRRLKEAVPRFQEVLRIKPQDQDAHFQLGIVLADLNRFEEAKRELLSIAPNSAHFAEAQKRLASIASFLANQPSASVAISSSPPNQITTPVVQASGRPVYTSEPANSQANSLQTSNSSVISATTNESSGPTTTPANPSTPSQPGQSLTALPASSPAPDPVSTLPNSTIKIIATGFSAPSGLAFDKHGNLYVANFTTNSIDRISSDGSKNSFVSGITLKGPIGMTIDDAGNLYVANYLSGNITRISPAGIMSVIGTGFKKPYYLTLDHDGNLFVSQQEDNSVVRIALPKGAVSARPH